MASVRFRMVLEGVSPVIVRTIEVPVGFSLAGLNAALSMTLDWLTGGGASVRDSVCRILARSDDRQSFSNVSSGWSADLRVEAIGHDPAPVVRCVPVPLQVHPRFGSVDAPAGSGDVHPGRLGGIGRSLR